MPDHFLSRYLDTFGSIPGWFLPDAYLVVAAYNQLLADEGLTGDVLEIGVYHGLSAIGFAALRGEGKRFVAVDLFDKTPGQHGDRSLFGDVSRFTHNMARFYQDLSFVTKIAALSASLRPEDLGFDFTVCHIDGGHSAGDVYSDLTLCTAASKAGGLIVLDDYSSPAFPGVAEGALKFNLDAPGTLRPVAIGFNKAVFQREPARFDLNERFVTAFPQVCARPVLLWDRPVPLFDTPLRPFIDVARSTPRRLANTEGQIAARLEPLAGSVTGLVGRTAGVAIQVTNLSRISLSCENAPFGLSYHLRTAGHAMIEYNNPRAYFVDPLAPNASRVVHVPVRVPDEPGPYELEFDVVWEGVLWMKDIRNPTAVVALTAVADGIEQATADAAVNAL